MKRTWIFLVAMAVTLYFGAATAFAQHGGGHGGGGGGGAAPGAAGGGGAGMGSSMGRGNETSPRGNATTGSNMSSTSMSHSNPTTLLSSNPKLASTLQTRLGPLLPAGTTLSEAASGFRNLGQFVAALHVSNNLGIPFTNLKAKMTSGDSLGKAIKVLRPEANSKAEAKKAKKEANNDLKGT